MKEINKFNINNMAEIVEDERFRKIHSDPQFRTTKQKYQKVKIDKRFRPMLTDKAFQTTYLVDKRGRRVNKSSNDDMHRFYRNESDSSSSEGEDDEKPPAKKEDRVKVKAVVNKEGGKKRKASDDSLQERSKDKRKPPEIDDNDSSVVSEESESESSIGNANVPDLARGEGGSSSSDDDDERLDGDEEDVEIDHGWGELDRDAPRIDDATHRLAACNMDWDRIKAQDLYMLVNSFKPKGGNINSVKVYLSDFGRERLKEEEVAGPSELRDKKGKDKTDKEGNPLEGSSYHREKLRRYQLNRMRYYYAVIDCDSVATASSVYEQCDGMEYECSANKFDLRFIPDEMTFDDEPKWVATGIDNPKQYKPSLFVNTALHQVSVSLTWDETPPDRLAVTMKDFTKEDLDEMDVKDYLASDTDVDEDPYGDLIAAYSPSPDGPNEVPPEDNLDDQINRYRDLIRSLGEAEQKKEDEGLDMEISWEPDLKEKTEKLVKKKLSNTTLTPWDEYLEKKKKRKREKKLKRLKSKEADDGESGDNIESDDDLPDGMDLDDPYFAEELGKTAKKSERTKKKKVPTATLR